MEEPEVTRKAEPAPGEVNMFRTSGEGQVFRIPLQAFPTLWGNVYVAVCEDYRVLIDTGSGLGDSSRHLELGLEAAGRISGLDLSLPNLTHILITHGHIDHYGGLNFIRPRTQAKLGIHELDRSVVDHHVERLSIVSRRLQEFLSEAGVAAEDRGSILGMYGMTKAVYQSVPVDFTFEAQGMHLGPFEMLHVPGHCPGQTVIRLHDVLFSGDHVLDHISPHQSPEHLMPSTGLSHYLDSLETLRPWSHEIKLTLSGHGAPVMDLAKRLNEIRDMHTERLRKVQEMLAQPQTVADVSRKLFGDLKGYNILLALEEAGAHVEYLYQRGMLRIENLSQLEESSGLVPILYQAI